VEEEAAGGEVEGADEAVEAAVEASSPSRLAWFRCFLPPRLPIDDVEYSERTLAAEGERRRGRPKMVVCDTGG
jgi:hypothetical protein